MKADQKHTPKYWVAHRTDIDDVYPSTMSESFHRCQNIFTFDILPVIGQEVAKTVLFSLIEIKLPSDTESYQYFPDEEDENE